MADVIPLVAATHEEGSGNVEPIDLWDAFWTLFPRHEAKKKAKMLWDKLSEAQQMAAVVAAADWRQVWAAQDRDETAIPYPSTWLYGERWEDEVPKSYRRPQPKLVGNGQAVEPFKRGEIPEHVKAMLAKLRAK